MIKNHEFPLSVEDSGCAHDRSACVALQNRNVVQHLFMWLTVLLPSSYRSPPSHLPLAGTERAQSTG